MSANALHAGSSRPAPFGQAHEPPQSMTDALLAPLDRLQKLSQTLFLALSPPSTKPPPPPPIEAFIEADADLASVLHQTRIHQRKQRQIESLTAEVLSLESRLREIASELERGKMELEEMIEEGNGRVKSIEKAKEGTRFCRH